MKALVKSLSIHPAAAALPMPAENDPVARAVVFSIREIGIAEPLKVSKNRIVDGRVRLRGALAAGLDEVPVVEVEEKDIVSLIVHTKLARTHYTKGALGYLFAPLMESELAASRKRRLQNLKIGVSTCESRSSTERTIGNASEIAEQIGISRTIFFEAQAIHKKFGQYPKLRDEWEPKILSGEMGLGQVQQALAGKIAALHGDTHPKGDAQQLLLELFSTAKVRFGRWESLNPKQRAAAIAQFRTDFLPSLPSELLEEAERFLAERLATA